MAIAHVHRKEPVIKQPPIDQVTLVLSPLEAHYLKIYFGHTFFDLRKIHMKDATNRETFNKFYPEDVFQDSASDIYRALTAVLGLDQTIKED